MEAQAHLVLPVQAVHQDLLVQAVRQVVQVLLGQMDHLGLVEQAVHQDLRVLQELQDQAEVRVHLGLVEQAVHQEHQEVQVQAVLREHQEVQVQAVLREHQDLVVLREQVEAQGQAVRAGHLDRAVLPALQVLVDQAELAVLAELQVLAVKMHYQVVSIYSLTPQLIVIFPAK